MIIFKKYSHLEIFKTEAIIVIEVIMIKKYIFEII